MNWTVLQAVGSKMYKPLGGVLRALKELPRATCTIVVVSAFFVMVSGPRSPGADSTSLMRSSSVRRGHDSCP